MTMFIQLLGIFNACLYSEDKIYLYNTTISIIMEYIGIFYIIKLCGLGSPAYRPETEPMSIVLDRSLDRHSKFHHMII